MIKYNFIKALTVGVSFVLMFYPQARADDTNIISGESCNNKCIWEYNTSTHDMVIKPKTDVTGDINVGSALRASFQSKGITEIRNATLAEGITGYDSVTFDSGNLSAYGTLKLPNSLKNITQSSISDVMFRTVEMSADNLETISQMTLRNVQTFILTPAEGKNLPSNFFGRWYGSGISWGNYWENYNPLNIQCKGNLEICRQNVLAAKGSLPGMIEYYVGDDGNGNWEVWSDDGLALYTDSTLQKPLGKYDMDGNQTGVYKYDGAGNLTSAYENGVSTYKRTSYTPTEAAAAVKKGNKNKVTLTFK